MPIAVIKTGGKQYMVEPGSVIKTEKIKGKEEGDDVAFDKVLLLANGDKEVAIGRPFLKDIKVDGEIMESGRDKKVITVKFKAKSHYNKKIGHKQPYMRIKILDF